MSPHPFSEISFVSARKFIKKKATVNKYIFSRDNGRHEFEFGDPFSLFDNHFWMKNDIPIKLAAKASWVDKILCKNQ